MGQVGGTLGNYIQLLIGSNSWNGTVDGDHLNLTLNGTNSAHMGQCTYQIIAKVSGVLTGDNLSGTIGYTTATNHSPDCGTIEGCYSFQNFNGSRPPR
jgi:hypothetical protein